MVRFWFGICACLVGLAAPASAGTVLVPVPPRALLEGSTRTVTLVISNTGAVVRRARPSFFPEGVDGSVFEPLVLPQIAVGPGASVVVENPTPGAGLLELVTAPQLLVRASLVLRDASGVELSRVWYPLVDDRSLRGPEESVELLGLLRGNGEVSDLVLTNADPEQGMECTIDLIDFDGGAVGTLTRVLPAYSMRTSSDLLAGLGSPLRARVECSGAWHAMALLTDYSADAHKVIEEAARGTSTLTPGGSPSCPGVCLSLPGLVHTATEAAPNRTLIVPVAPGRTFARLRLDFDLRAGDWYPPDSGNNHSLFWIHRGRSLTAYDRNVFGVANARGTSNRLRLVTNIDMAPGDHTFDNANLVLTPGTTYHVSYDIENATRRATLRISRDGAEIAAIATTVGGAVASASADAFMLYFGHALDGAGYGVPWYGASWSNLAFEAIP